MDKFGVMIYLLKEYNEYGTFYPKSAKDISTELNLPLCETYLTLDALQNDGLIWREGKKNFYRYQLNGDNLVYLNKLYLCLTSGKQLPEELLIDYHKLDEIADNHKKFSENLKKEETLSQEIKSLLGRLEFMNEDEQLENIDSTIDDIIEKYSKDEFDESFKSYLEDKLVSIWEYIIGARLVEG